MNELEKETHQEKQIKFLRLMNILSQC